MKTNDKLIIEKQAELIEWLETECQSPETADLSHSFAENLMIKLTKISYLKLSALEAEVPEEKVCTCGGYPDCICNLTHKNK